MVRFEDNCVPLFGRHFGPGSKIILVEVEGRRRGRSKSRGSPGPQGPSDNDASDDQGRHGRGPRGLHKRGFHGFGRHHGPGGHHGPFGKHGHHGHHGYHGHHGGRGHHGRWHGPCHSPDRSRSRGCGERSESPESCGPHRRRGRRSPSKECGHPKKCWRNKPYKKFGKRCQKEQSDSDNARDSGNETCDRGTLTEQIVLPDGDQTVIIKKFVVDKGPRCYSV